MAVPATYTKLRSGNWGIRVEGPVRVGSPVQVRKQSGEIKTERVSAIVWTGQGITLCAIDPGASGARTGPYQTIGVRMAVRTGWTGCRCGSIEGQPRDSDCESCTFDNS